MQTILLHDGTFEGLLTAIFDTYVYPPPVTVAEAANCQQELDCCYCEIPTDSEKARRVISGICSKLGREGYEAVWRAFLHASDDKNRIICDYVRLGMKVGKDIRHMLTDDRVMAFDALCREVNRETMLMTEFLRFAQLEGGIYYGAIEPEHAILPLLMPHFVDRFQIQPFIIHDKVHRIAGVYDKREWYLTSAEDMLLPPYSEQEHTYRYMWKVFYDTIAIKERLNPALRRQHMPKKYWKNIIEMQPLEWFTRQDGAKREQTTLPASKHILMNI